MSEGDQSEKTHEPSQKRLDDARKRGEVARSSDLSAAAAWGGLLLAFSAAGGTFAVLAGNGAVLLDQAETLAPLLFDGSHALFGELSARIAWALVPVFALPAGAVVAVLVAQGAITMAPEKLLPKMSRISPVANAKQKFGRAGLFEFGKNALKMAAIGILLAVFLLSRTEEIASSVLLPASGVVEFLGQVLLDFLGLVFVMMLVFGIADYLWQRLEHVRRNRMSRQELTDEMKESEGDPHVKHQRRQRGQDIALNQMIADVPKANVVIVNPTHYAVALKWSRQDQGPPVCVAKGTDAVAARIREAAMAAGVPVRSDPPTARALHATVAVGDHIRQEHFRAVAAAIRFADRMRQQAGRGWRG